LKKIKPLIKKQLNWLTVLFLGLYSVILTLSPTVKYHTWNVPLTWSHWLGFILWLCGFLFLLKIAENNLKLGNPILINVMGLLVGWGILSIWRINFIFGLRQTLWFLICITLSHFFFKQPTLLSTFKKYKNLLLAFGLLLSALTFLFGTFPGGEGPRLWLGIRGLYFQPSELLKIILIIYLSAYFSENTLHKKKFFPTIFPTIILVFAALFMLIAQHDLGTALIFMAIYIFMLFIAFDKKRILAIGLGIIGLSALIGYFSIDLVRIRFQGWMLPWSDTQAGSYQITQSIIAIASGELLGSGIGLGNPRLIPIAQSDFIYSAIAEETGFLGSAAVIILFAILFFKGLSIAKNAGSLYYRYLAAGISLIISSQVILIIGGNIRLFPITGVTLPFLSYGGSSLLVSFFSVCILLFIESNQVYEIEIQKEFRASKILALIFSSSFILIALISGWWAIIRSNDLQLREDNPRHLLAAQFVKRGTILDRNDSVIVNSVGETGHLLRQNLYPPLSNTTGFVDSSYGSAGLEASQEDYLGGEKGYPPFDLWLNHILYDQPLPGRDIRLTVDLNLQKGIDDLLKPYISAAIVMNSENGEVLSISSNPYINSNDLKTFWETWKADPASPFINRVVQGAYPADSLFTPFLLSQINLNDLPEFDPAIKPLSKAISPNCAIVEYLISDMRQAITNGCPTALIQIVGATGKSKVEKAIAEFNLEQTPDIGLPGNPIIIHDKDILWNDLFFSKDPLRVNPLQIATSASVITNGGSMPTPILVSAVNTLRDGWTSLSIENKKQVLPADQANSINDYLKSGVISGWELTAQGFDQRTKIAWYVAGTPTNWAGKPLTIVLVLENQDPIKAREIGREIYELSVR
jgi:cell division protein FtsW (lipid II flippase)